MIVVDELKDFLQQQHMCFTDFLEGELLLFTVYYNTCASRTFSKVNYMAN